MLGGDLTAGSGSGSMPKASSPPMLTRLTPKTIFLDSSEKVQYVMHTHVYTHVYRAHAAYYSFSRIHMLALNGIM